MRSRIRHIPLLAVCLVVALVTPHPSPSQTDYAKGEIIIKFNKSAAPQAVADVYLEDEFTITAGTSGLLPGQTAKVNFLSIINGQIDLGLGGGFQGTSNHSYVSGFYPGPQPGRLR